MQENDILNELDQLASENSHSAEFSDDPHGHMDGSAGAENGLARVLGGKGGSASARASSSGGGGGIESLNMLDSDDGADMDFFDDDDDDAYGGGDDFVERSPNSFAGHNSNSNKDIAASLSEDFQALLNTPLTIPTLGQSKGKRDGGDSEPTEELDLPTSDDEHDEDDHEDDDDDEHEDDDDKSSDSGEDYTDDEDEGESGYKPGGYHPVQVGDVFNQK